jgi:hypothetical protein
MFTRRFGTGIAGGGGAVAGMTRRGGNVRRLGRHRRGCGGARRGVRRRGHRRWRLSSLAWLAGLPGLTGPPGLPGLPRPLALVRRLCRCRRHGRYGPFLLRLGLARTSSAVADGAYPLRWAARSLWWRTRHLSLVAVRRAPRSAVLLGRTTVSLRLRRRGEPTPIVVVPAAVASAAPRRGTAAGRCGRHGLPRLELSRTICTVARSEVPVMRPLAPAAVGSASPRDADPTIPASLRHTSPAISDDGNT